MIYNALKIKRFKQFNDQKIEFNKDITLIVGCNGSGKATLFNMMKKRRKGYSIEYEGIMDAVFIDEDVLDRVFKNDVNDSYIQFLDYLKREKGESKCYAHIAFYFVKEIYLEGAFSPSDIYTPFGRKFIQLLSPKFLLTLSKLV